MNKQGSRQNGTPEIILKLMTGIFPTQLFGKFFPCAAVAILALQKVQGAELYLALVGPPPLRFEPAPANDPVFMAELELPKPKDTGTTVAILPNNSPAATASVPVRAASNNVLSTANPSGILSDAAKNAEGLGRPASNLLGVMPRMITEYLKPIQTGPAAVDPNAYQPGETILVPAELGFVPPTPGQSRAIYQSR